MVAQLLQYFPCVLNKSFTIRIPKVIQYEISGEIKQGTN